MNRRHHRHPKSLAEFIDAAIDHFEEDWSNLVAPRPTPQLVARGPRGNLDTRGKLAGRQSGQLSSYSESELKSWPKFRIRIEISGG
jgi:hypothetical protein